MYEPFDSWYPWYIEKAWKKRYLQRILYYIIP